MFAQARAVRCSHEKLEYLGSDFPAEFFRCETCGAVLVRGGRRTWQVGSPKAAA